MIKKPPSNQSCGRDRECKMCVFKVPQYIKCDTLHAKSYQGLHALLLQKHITLGCTVHCKIWYKLTPNLAAVEQPLTVV